MQRQQGGLVPISEALADLGGPVKAIREASPQARHHFTQADQVNQLISASEAEPERGFMARMMALCSLPRTNPGNQHQYTRVNGPYKLIMSTTGEYKLPFGHLPRLLMAWIFDGGRAHSKPRVGFRGLALRVHAGARHLQQRRQSIHPAPQPDGPAL